MDESVLSRKEKLALWRAAKKAPEARAGAGAGTGAGAGAGGKGKGKSTDSGVLAPRPGAGNGVKRAAPRLSKGVPQRKPFQVDTRSIHEASERRVQPGTPIHSLKKRLKRTAVAVKPAPRAPGQAGVEASEGGGGGGGTAVAATSKVMSGTARAVSASIPTARAQGKAKAAAAARVPGHVNGVSRSLDSARTKEVSDYLKSQISEANMLLEISGVDAARTLLADLLPCTGAARGVGELALYWAARAKLEEDAGMYLEARQLLDEGEAYISMPTQQKVMAKVMGAFEGRMSERAEADVDRLLEDSVDGLSLNDSAANSNSPTSSAPFRYDPNDLSLEDDSGNADSAIKNLNFSKIARENSGVGSAGSSSNTSSNSGGGGGGGGGSSSSSSSSVISATTMMGVSPEWIRDSIARGGSSTAPSLSSAPRPSMRHDGSGGSGGGAVSMSGVIYSDDDSDVSISDIDEGVIARAHAFAEEEEARKVRMAAEDAGRDAEDAVESVLAEENENDEEDEEDEEEIEAVRDDHDGRAGGCNAEAEAEAKVAADPALGGKVAVNEIGQSAPSSSNTRGTSSLSSSSVAMAPPPPQPAKMAAAAAAVPESREPKTRKGTPHPKPKLQSKRRGKVDDGELSPGSFIAQVEAKGKDGQRTLTPVRRSRRISSVYKEATPAMLRKEMEAML